ncbi:MAG: phospholipase A2 [Acidimicrobiales bacterium]
MHQTALADLARWWTTEQAALHHVPPSTIERWVASASARLDDEEARSGSWDLSTDLCSFAPDAGPGFDFRWPCIRHDLAWRNLKRLDRLAGGGIDTRARRLRANERFRADLEASCRARAIVERAACRTLAAAYGRAVDLAA